MLRRTLCNLGFFGSKQITAVHAAELVHSESTINVAGFVGHGSPEEILIAIKNRFIETQKPANLTLVFHGGPGDWDCRGLNHLALPGMLKRTIGSHYGQTPMIGELAKNNKIEAYNFPMGSISRMIRATASHQPAFITRVGLNTLADPKHGGGKINSVTKEDLVTEIELYGQKLLAFRTFRIDVAIIRGTTADPNGNLTMEREALYYDALVSAMAARASGGMVIAQVERIAAKDSLNPKHVKVPGTLVDAVVETSCAENHPMTFATKYHPGWSAEVRVPPRLSPVPLDIRKMIARRAALSLLPSYVINLGIGMPEAIANVAEEEDILSVIELTAESGPHGGIGASGHNFGAATNYNGLLEINQQFDFYDGGGLDAAFLGMGDVDPSGDVNVTRIGSKLTGPGGFINISQSTQRIFLLGTFTTKGLEVAVEKDKNGDPILKIVKEGKVKKFVKSIPEIAFSAKTAIEGNQIVSYITERAVFMLTKEGLELVEVAPGIDIQKDIVDQMEFKPIIREPIPRMTRKIFTEGKMGLRDRFFGLDMHARMYYSNNSNTLFVDLSSLMVQKEEDCDKIIADVRGLLDRLRQTSGQPKKMFRLEWNNFGFSLAPIVRPYWKAVESKLIEDYVAEIRHHYGRTFAKAKSMHPMRKVPDNVTITDAFAYMNQHGIPIGLADFRAACYRELSKSGAEVVDSSTTLSRDQFSAVLDVILTRLRAKQKSPFFL